MAAAVGAVELARDAVAHAGWYLRYQVSGTTHEGEGPSAGEHSSAGPSG